MISFISYLKRHYILPLKEWKADLSAALWVFMFSLPLSLAIAQASNFSVSAGLITAVVGGVVVGLLSGSPLSIKGPSVSLVFVISWAVFELSPYPSTGIRYALACVVMAGIIQIALGLFKMGKWLSWIPNPVIYGIISGISLLVFVQQLAFFSGDTDFTLPSLWVFAALPAKFLAAKPMVLSIGLIMLGVLFLPSILGQQFSKNLPGVFWVLLLGLMLGIYYNLPQSQINWLYLPSTWAQLWTEPDFSIIFSFQSVEYAILITLISTLESQINTHDTEILDIWRRKSSTHFELISIGIGNVLCGLLGGLPLAATVENSSINIKHEAKSRWAGIFQGFLILLFLLLGLGVLAYLPSVVLVAVLIYEIYRLNSPKLYQGILETGREQFSIFLVSLGLTFFAGVWAGLLGGVLFALGTFVNMRSSLVSLLYAHLEVTGRGKSKVKVVIKGAALCTNYLSIQNRLQKLLDHDRIIIDLSDCEVVEHGFLEQIYEFAYWNNLNDGRMELQGLRNHYPTSMHPLATMRKNTSVNFHKQYQKRFTERQRDLRAVAAVNNTTLETQLSYDGVVLQGFNFARGYEIRYRENKFLKFLGNNPFEFSDVFLSRGLRLSDQNHKISVCLVTVLDVPLPDFNLHQEHLIDKVWQSIGHQDINFADFPLFSQSYLLNGKEEVKIRNLFTESTIRFLEEHLSFEVNIEALNNRLLIYRSRSLLQKNEVEDFIEFTEQFLDKIKHSEHRPVANIQNA